jgi:DNA mismatch repair protein MutS
MVSKTNNIFNEYIELYNKYKKLYGEKSIVIMEVGMFYEMYSLNDGNNGPPLNELSSLLNILYTKKNKNVKEISQKNPYMAGVPIHSIDKYIDILIKNNFTIIIVNQYDNEMGSKSKKIRKVDEIISPSTYVNDVVSYKSNYLMVIYFYKFKDRKTKKNIMSASISTIELSIGKVYLYEIINKDNKLLFDNIYRVILKYNPSEIVVFGNDFDFDNIKTNLNLEDKCFHNQIDNYNEKILDINYQKEILKQVYKNTGMLNPIEYINLEKNQELLISFINLINFSYSHNQKIIQKINIPLIIDNNDRLFLGYNLVQKLNIISDNDNKFSSLLNILNNSNTNIGKRFLKDCLLNPLTNIQEINDKYDNIELMLLKKDDTYIYELIRKKLENICDLERYFRKINLLKLHPLEFLNIYKSLKYFHEILKDINNFVKINNNFKKFNKLNNIRETSELIKFLENHLNLKTIDKYNYDNINGHIFKTSVYSEIDNLQTELDNNIDYFNNTANELNNIDNTFKNFFKVEFNDNLGYFLQITQNRFNIFKRNSKYNLQDITTKKISQSSSTLRVFLPNFYINNEQIILLKSKIKEKCTEIYKQFCKDLFEKYENKFNEIVKQIELIDYSSTNAYNSILYKYSKPIIDDTFKNSYLNIKNVRHPIIEIINEDIKYIANDIKLGIDEEDGILLYGMNSSGKSSLMKSIGLVVIMAQAGMYVPCNEMKYYPYNKIFSRIPGGDDIFKGQSTFVGEISEIRNILKSADDRTLVIGDELCSGTETNSAISIVSAGILDLIKKKSSFIFATHLHELSDMKRIKDIPNLSIKHLSVSYKQDNNSLIFDRVLKDGSGDSIYGLEVCRSLDLDNDFVNLANTIRQEILGTESLIKYKKSKYNANLIIHLCNICKKNNATETHHIRFQRDADENGFIEHFHKNKKFNLIGLCEKCHNCVHNGDLEINEAIMTSNGIQYS